MRWPGSRSCTCRATSTIVRPVPTSSTGPAARRSSAPALRGIADEARGIGGPSALGQRGIAWRKIAEREHDAIGAQARAVGQRQPAARDADDLALPPLERGARRGQPLTLCQHRLEVGAEDHAGHERRGLDGGVVLLAEEAQEVIRVVRETAHARGRHVQQVAGEARAVRHATAKPRAALDQHDVRATGPEKLRGEQRPTGAGADDRDDRAKVFCVYEFDRHLCEYAAVNQIAPVSRRPAAQNRDARPGPPSRSESAFRSARHGALITTARLPAGVEPHAPSIVNANALDCRPRPVSLNEPTDAQLIERWQRRGDDAAREQLVHRYRGLVRALAARYVNWGEPLR